MTKKDFVTREEFERHASDYDDAHMNKIDQWVAVFGFLFGVVAMCWIMVALMIPSPTSGLEKVCVENETVYDSLATDCRWWPAMGGWFHTYDNGQFTGNACMERGNWTTNRCLRYEWRDKA